MPGEVAYMPLQFHLNHGAGVGAPGINLRLEGKLRT